MMRCFVLTAVCVAISIASASEEITSARIESCKGCSLNRLPQVKSFIMEDVPEYEGVEVKFISGAPPELVLLSEEKEIERLPLSQLNRIQCNELLQQKGFLRRQKEL